MPYGRNPVVCFSHKVEYSDMLAKQLMKYWIFLGTACFKRPRAMDVVRLGVCRGGGVGGRVVGG
jgi:hypothetical protein